MANPEHLQELEKGSDSWKKWLLNSDKQGKYRRNIDLSGSDLSDKDLSNYCFFGVNLKGSNLQSSDLTNVNFNWADLSSADLSKSTIRQGQFHNAELNNAKFIGSDLFRAVFIFTQLNGTNFTHIDGRQTYFAKSQGIGVNFSSSFLENADFLETNLQQSNFTSAGLIKADLSGSDLTKANFQKADLSMSILFQSNLTDSILIDADLSGVGAWNTNFKNADLSGSCIDGWRTNTDTNFEDVQCTHIYLKPNQQERIPYKTSDFFDRRDFQKFIQKAQNTVDLIFTSGIDWQAFLQAFLKLKSETGDELSIHSIEDKWDGYFVIRVNVPPDADKKEIEMLLKIQDTKIEGYRRENTNLLSLLQLALQKPDQAFYGATYGVAGSLQGDQKIYPLKPDTIQSKYNENEE